MKEPKIVKTINAISDFCKYDNELNNYYVSYTSQI